METLRLGTFFWLQSQAGREDCVSQAQQVKHQIAGLEKLVRESEALKALQDAAAEAGFAEKTAVVVAVSVSLLHKADPFDGSAICYSFCSSLDSSAVGVWIF